MRKKHPAVHDMPRPDSHRITDIEFASDIQSAVIAKWELGIFFRSDHCGQRCSEVPVP